jgi:Putative antitoxin
MATKTITLELDAYEKLKSRKRGRESFSSVVRRARWDDSATAGHVLDALRDLHRLHPESFLDDATLDRIEARASSRTRRVRPNASTE